jgi:hypothetical protein
VAEALHERPDVVSFVLQSARSGEVEVHLRERHEEGALNVHFTGS